MYAVEVENLSKTYKGRAVPAVNSINFRINRGEIFGLLGPNGAGKTTTISILCGLLKSDQGKVSIGGLSHQGQHEQIKKLIGVIPQEIALYPTLTAYENLTFAGNMFGLFGSTLNSRIITLLEAFGLTTHSGKLVKEYSGGMKRRLNIIAGLIHEPEIIFLDEPTSGVDVHSRSLILDYLRDRNREGVTMIYTSHLMEEAQNICTRIAIIDHGMILCEGKPMELIQRYDSTDLESLFLKLTGRQLRDS
jgi:ABC-2 type transport system ATP-binding protein